MNFPTLAIFILFLGTLVPVYRAQEPCKPPEIVFNRNAPNLFDEQQEMYLGDVVSEYVGSRYRVISDEEANRYVRAVGERLIKHMPPTTIKFRFSVVDLPELNAFTAVGGRIYITRKMIAFVKNEDELAGIIAHELGHGIVRHGSQDWSMYFRKVLNIDRVGDREGITRKFHEFIDRRFTKTVEAKPGHLEDKQLEADRIGLFAMMAAGYDADAFASTWDRLAETKGKTGNFFSEAFGTTNPNQKRLREIIKAAATVPASCDRTDKNRSQDDFLKWQSYVLTTSTFAKSPQLVGLVAMRQLTPDLRGDVKHFQFSPDGAYILAQDVSGINILTREPFKFIYRIPAPDAKFASFSPDSSTISFQTFGLRVESWDIAKQGPIVANEVYSRSGCWQSKLSPDGKYLACYSRRGSLELIDVATNETMYSKERFYIPFFFEVVNWQFLLNEGGEKEIDAMQMEFSPDGNYFLGGKVFRFSIREASPFPWVYNAPQQEALIAYDFLRKQEITLSGDLKAIVSSPFAFYGSTKLVGQHRKNPENSGIFTFPEGKRIEKFFMNAESYTPPFKGDYLFVRPTMANPVGVFNLKTKKFMFGNKTPAMDGWGDTFISEGKDAIVDLIRMDEMTGKVQTLGSVELPKNNIGDVKAVAVASDLSLLALSEDSRGGIWDLKTGEMKRYVRGFRGAYFDGDGKAYIDLPKFADQERSIGLLDAKGAPAGDTLLHTIDTRRTRQFGKYLIRTITKQDDESKRKNSGKEPTRGSDEPGKQTSQIDPGFLTGIENSSRYSVDGSLEIYDTTTKKLLWSKGFDEEIPLFDIDPSSDKVCMYWHLTTKAAQAILKSRPTLAAQSKAMGVKAGDYLIQVANASTGEIVQEMLIETGEGSFSIKRATAKGNWLAITDSQNRIQLYSIDSGKLAWRYFGSKVTLSPEKGLAAIENLAGQVSIYDLNTGQKLTELFFPSDVLHSAFNATGGMLGVVTADQIYYQMTTSAFKKPKK